MGLDIVVRHPGGTGTRAGSPSVHNLNRSISGSTSADSDDGYTHSNLYDKNPQFLRSRSSSMHSVHRLHRSVQQGLALGRATSVSALSQESRMIEKIQNSVIGEGHVFQGPFGPRRCLYLDQTASGRCVYTIEDFILENVMPVYANTHTTTSHCASQISAYREEAREVVKKYCGGGQDDEVIFCGNGATAAVHKLVNSVVKPGDQPPFVILGPYEHHSNVLPWREITKDVITIGEDSRGYVDLGELASVLKSVKKAASGGRTIIGSFSAGSNVTGGLTDDVAVTTLLHKYGAFSFWDYAAAAPHVQIQMNPSTGEGSKGDKLARKDALFFSGHKFLGGPQTPGVLVVKKHVLRNSVPDGHGGGTVLFVTKESHQYVEDPVERNEGGTPNIIGSIRLGLVLQMQTSVGLPNVVSREADFTMKVLGEWAKHPEILVLGHKHSIRLPIVSFMIRHLETGHFLHQDFVVALLNDLFGVQLRSGCMCAGPYAQGLLGMDEQLAKDYEEILSKPSGNLDQHGKPEADVVFKPGFIRMSLPYHASYEEIDFAINAVIWVAKHGWKLLPFYKMDVAKGTFRFNGRQFKNQVQRRRIQSFLDTGVNLNLVLSEKDHHPLGEECLEFAGQLVESVEQVVPDYGLDDHNDTSLFHPDCLRLRWFLLPSEALQLIKSSFSLREMDSKDRSGIIFPSSPLAISRPFKPKVDYQVPTGKDASQSQGSIPNNMQSILSKGDIPLFPVRQIDGNRLQEGNRSFSLSKLFKKRSNRPLAEFYV